MIILLFVVLTRTTQRPVKKYPCVCAFDIDDTITTRGSTVNEVHVRAMNAMNECKKNGCKIVFNTARVPSDSKWSVVEDIPKEFVQNIDSEHDIYHGETGQCSFLNYDCLKNQIADTKVKHLKNIANKYELKHSDVILFDDLYQNITKAQEHGFSTVHANHPSKGIDSNFRLVLE